MRLIPIVIAVCCGCAASVASAQDDSTEAQLSRAAARYMATELRSMTIALDTTPRPAGDRHAMPRGPGSLSNAELAREVGASRTGAAQDFYACLPGGAPNCGLRGVDAVVRFDEPRLRGDTAVVLVHVEQRGPSLRRPLLSTNTRLRFVRQDGAWVFVRAELTSRS